MRDIRSMMFNLSQQAIHLVHTSDPSLSHLSGLPRLQIDTDDELNVMWGDAGMIYFWVEEDKARKGDFSNTWLVRQCG